MGLDISARGALDSKIDDVVKNHIPELAKLYKLPSKKAEYQLKSEDDFIFGFAVGSLVTDFTHWFTTRYSRKMNTEEIDEALDVIDRRAADIRNAIFNTG